MYGKTDIVLGVSSYIEDDAFLGRLKVIRAEHAIGIIDVPGAHENFFITFIIERLHKKNDENVKMRSSLNFFKDKFFRSEGGR